METKYVKRLILRGFTYFFRIHTAYIQPKHCNNTGQYFHINGSQFFQSHYHIM